MNLNCIIHSNGKLPIVMASTNNQSPLLHLLQEYRAPIIKQLHQHGAILFRGFACEDAKHFSKAIDICALGTRCSTSDYELARTVLPDNIYTSSDLPGHIAIPLHHEKPRSKKPPNHLYFCCITPAQTGGATLFANAADIWVDMPETIQNKIQEHGVLYKHYFHAKSIQSHLIQKVLGEHSARCWSDYFGTEDKKQLEKKLTQDQLDWEWVSKGRNLILTNRLPGALEHPTTHQTLWFNVASYLNYYSNLLYGELASLNVYKSLMAKYLILKDMLPLVCHYGDGQAFSADEVTAINRIIQHHTWVLNWEKGDFMVVDNFTLMHGKQKHQGDRLLYSCMTET